MKKKQKIIVSITGIVLVVLILLGLTYAYFVTRIRGNTNNKSISVTTAELSLVYADGNGLISAQKIRPGTTISEKTFTVTNDGDDTVSYGVYLEDVINTFERTEDLELTVTCTSSVANTTCNGYTGSMVTTNDLIIENSIDEDEVQTYSLTLEYAEAGVDQSVDMKKAVEAKVQIYGLDDTVDVAGTISDANSGDYVVVNSTPKRSQIINGSYKVVGLLPGNHTISVYSSNDTLRYTKNFTLTKGNSESVSGNTVTLMSATRVVTIDVSSSSISASIEKFPAGTLAAAIYNNASNTTQEQITAHYAELSLTPKTTPGTQASGASEGTLSAATDDYGTSYYFRGNVINNYVNFAGMCWRAVRIEGDGSTKLILEDKAYECNSGSFTGDWKTSESFFGATNSQIDLLNYEGSGLYQALATYQTTLNTKIGTAHSGKGLSDYLKVDDWCYDATKINSSIYAPKKRIYTDKAPSLVCTGTQITKYSDNSTDMYVGSLTIDEVVYSGIIDNAFIGSWNNNQLPTTMSNYYLIGNSLEANVYPNRGFWTLSPSFIDSEVNIPCAFAVGVKMSNGDYYTNLMGSYAANNEYGELGENQGVRPAVTLKAGVLLGSGSGTKTSPYILQ